MKHDTIDPTLHAIVVMGVSGSGKSTIGEALAHRLGWRFEDGDSFHPLGNVAKMKAGHPLNDADRRPWLEAISAEIERIAAARSHIVIACSALKRAYRDIVAHGRSDIRIVFLDGSEQLISERLKQRKGHFMPPGLLASQFAALEVPSADEHVISVSIDADVETIVANVPRKLPSQA